MQLPWAKHKNQQRNPHLMEGQSDYVFRRSRTITGTTAATVSASAPKRGQFKTDRLRLIELREHRRQVLKALFGVVCASALLAWLVATFIATPAITFPQKGTHQPNLTTYQQSFSQYFDDHPLERFGFLLQPATLESAVVHDHPEVLGVAFERNWYGGNATFSIMFRKPLLAWTSGGKKFYVDAQGLAFTYNHFAEPTLTVADQSGIPPDQSGVVASTRFIRFLGQMVSAINGYGKGAVTQIIIPPATREIDLKLTGRDYIVKTNTDRDPNQEAEDIVNALTFFDTHGIKPQYIDVRVAHKAFYK